MGQQTIVELVLFTLKEGYTEEQFLAASDAVMRDLSAAPGFLSRELLKDEHGQWVDQIHWNSLEEALASAATFPTMESAQSFMEMIDLTNTQMLHLEQLRSYKQ